MYTSICPKCKGEGKVKKGLFSKEMVTCQKCWGMGKIEENDEFQNAIHRMALLRSRFINAKNQGKDIEELMKLLYHARKALKNKDYENANLYIDRVEEKLNRLS